MGCFKAFVLMTWTLIIFAIVVCIVLVIRRAAKGPTYTLKTVERPVKDLLKRGYNGGFLIIDIHRSKYFLQLRKYIHCPGIYGIELDFPNAKWSVHMFPKLIDYCEHHNISYRIGKEIADKPLEFLRIGFGKDADKAYKIITDIILQVFNLDEDVKLYAALENASTDDDLIDG